MIKQLTSVFAGILLFIVIITFFSSVYIVDETQQVFETRFGKIIGDTINGPGKKEAGLKFRVPFITKVHAFEKRYLEWDGAPNQVTTKDKLFIFIDTYARWRIVDAKLFFEKVRNEIGAQARLDDILDGEARIVVAGNDLVEVIRSRQREAVVDETEVLDDESQLKPFQRGPLRAGEAGARQCRAKPQGGVWHRVARLSVQADQLLAGSPGENL